MKKTFVYYASLYSLLILCLIPDGACRKANSSRHKIRKAYNKEDNVLESIPDFPLDFSQVFTDASDVFRNILGKMLGQKRLVGINTSEWYW